MVLPLEETKIYPQRKPKTFVHWENPNPKRKTEVKEFDKPKSKFHK